MYRPETPFDSIENAQEYLRLLSEVIAEAKQTVEADFCCVGAAGDSQTSRALQLICYKLEKLGTHIRMSRRILNDLLMLGRLLDKQPNVKSNDGAHAAASLNEPKVVYDGSDVAV